MARPERLSFHPKGGVEEGVGLLRSAASGLGARQVAEGNRNVGVLRAEFVLEAAQHVPVLGERGIVGAPTHLHIGHSAQQGRYPRVISAEDPPVQGHDCRYSESAASYRP